MADRSHDDVVMRGGLACHSLPVQLERRGAHDYREVLGKSHLVAEQLPKSAMLAEPSMPAPVKNSRLIPAVRKKTGQAERALGQAEAARDAIPPGCPPK
jgi:hypothetical protein